MTEKKTKSLWDLFSNEVPDKAPTRNTPLPPAPVGTPVGGTGPGTSWSAAGPVGPDPKALASLEARLQASLPPDYAAFMETFQSIAEDIPDERARFKVALKTTHSNVDSVLAAIDQLAATMEAAHQDFNQKLEGKLQAQHALEETMTAKAQQLQQLQEELQALDVQKKEGQTKIANARLGFEAALKQVMDRLATQKTRISAMR